MTPGVQHRKGVRDIAYHESRYRHSSLFCVYRKGVYIYVYIYILDSLYYIYIYIFKYFFKFLYIYIYIHVYIRTSLYIISTLNNAI